MKRSYLSRLLALALPMLFARSFVTDPGGGGANPPSPAPAPAEPQSFSLEYVRELREENKGWRLKIATLEKERDDALGLADKATKDAGEQVKTAASEADRRILRSELKAHALKAGIVDLDALQLADLSTVKMNEKGEVEGAEALFEGLKKAKPYLFGQPQNSSTPANPPTNTPPAAKLAKDMNPAEYAAARAALVAAG